MNSKFNFVVLIGLLVLCLSVVSADTVFGGTIFYDVIYGTPVGAGVVVSVVCDITTLNDTTANDGSYGVNFNEVDCNVSDSYIISASEGNYSGTDNGTVSGSNILKSLAVVEIIPNSKTVFGGKVFYDYDLNPAGNGTGAGVVVSVVCDITTLNDTTANDGSYGVNFNEVDCGVGDDYTISASEGNYSGAVSNIVSGSNIMKSLVLDEVIPQNTTISGIIYYDVINGSLVDGAKVTIICGDEEEEFDSVNGSYSFDFLESVCNDSHIYSVFAIKGDYNGTSGDLNVSAGTDVDVVILKAVVVPTCSDGVQNGDETGVDCGGSCGSCSTSGGGPKITSSGGGWVNPNCDEGFHYETGVGCILDVVIENVTEENEGDAFNASSAGEVPEEDESNEFFSDITGGIIGAGAARNIGIGLLFLLIILALFSIVRSHKKK